MIRPPHLKRGDLVRIIAPASHFDRERFNRGVRVLEQELGFRTAWRDDLFTQQRFLAGDDSRRAAELHDAFNDSEARAVFCARGGYGSARILRRLDSAVFRDHPKVLMGFSDVTALLLWMQRHAGLVVFHGPMVTGRMSDGLSDADRDALIRTLSRPEPAGLLGQGATLVEGEAEGPLVGGSLAMLAAGVGTPYEPDTEGSILFLEDVGEKPYRLDRMLRQLLQAGLLDDVAGLALGDFVGCDNPADPENDAAAILEDFARELAVPCVAQLPFGHGESNRVVPLGVRARLGDGALTVLEAAVS